MFCKTDQWSQKASVIAQHLFGSEITVMSGAAKTPIPVSEASTTSLDYLISFLSPWILPRWLLERAASNINFHPGSHDYPGAGCYNFALYECASQYGCVCHKMEEKVDTGKIYFERIFDVYPTDTVETLKFRTMVELLSLVQDVLKRIKNGEGLPSPSISWTRKPFRIAQLDGLGRIEPNMSPEEVRRRVRAVTYPGYPGAVIDIHGVAFRADVPQRPPLA